MLVDIKIELSKIARDNNKFAEEIVEFRSLIPMSVVSLTSRFANVQFANLLRRFANVFSRFANVVKSFR